MRFMDAFETIPKCFIGGWIRRKRPLGSVYAQKCFVIFVYMPEYSWEERRPTPLQTVIEKGCWRQKLLRTHISPFGSFGDGQKNRGAQFKYTCFSGGPDKK